MDSAEVGRIVNLHIAGDLGFQPAQMCRPSSRIAALHARHIRPVTVVVHLNETSAAAPFDHTVIHPAPAVIGSRIVSGNHERPATCVGEGYGRRYRYRMPGAEVELRCACPEQIARHDDVARARRQVHRIDAHRCTGRQTVRKRSRQRGVDGQLRSGNG